MGTNGVTLTLGDLVDRLGGELIGERGQRIEGVATLESAGPAHISFLASHRYRRQLVSSGAGAVVLASEDRDRTTAARIVVANPYAYFARVSALLNPEPARSPGIHPSAVVDPAARVAASATVGPLACIEAGAVVGERSLVGPGCILGRGARIGDDTRLVAQVTIYHDCVVGSRCLVHASVVIGADGFGMADEGGRWLKVPQVGRAVVGNDVEIGAGTTIDRGALGDTLVADGVKLDNQIQVGHNVVIGSHTAVAGCVGIAGSTRIGQHCRIGGAAMLHGHLQICDGVVVAAGTTVQADITEPGLYDGFFPARPHREWMKNLARFNRLDELARTVRVLEARLEALENSHREPS